jgi:hypothetical protein
VSDSGLFFRISDKAKIDFPDPADCAAAAAARERRKAVLP